jgi:hypothetical protein
VLRVKSLSKASTLFIVYLFYYRASKIHLKCFSFFCFCLCAEQYDIIRRGSENDERSERKKQQAKLDDIKKIE